MAEKQLHVLVTGASGFVGRAAVDALSASGALVTATARSTYDGPAEFIRADLSSPTAVGEISTGRSFDIVVNCAGLAHQFGAAALTDFKRGNVDTAGNAARIATETGARRMIHVSSVAVYGASNGGVVVNESEACRPLGDYAATKFEAEETVASICRQAEVELVTLRPATVIGVGDPGNTSRLIRAIANRRFVRIGALENRKSLVDRIDVARAISLAAIADGDAVGIYNVSAEPLTMSEIVDAIFEGLDRPKPRFRVPAWPFRAAASFNRATFRVGAVAKIGATLEKFLGEECYDGRRFASKFEGFDYSDVSETLRIQAAAMR